MSPLLEDPARLIVGTVGARHHGRATTRCATRARPTPAPSPMPACRPRLVRVRRPDARVLLDVRAHRRRPLGPGAGRRGRAPGLRPGVRRLTDADQLDGAGEHGVEHRLGEAAGERVLLARVERAQQRRAAGDDDLDAVAEPRAWPHGVVTGAPRRSRRRRGRRRPSAGAPRARAARNGAQVSRSAGVGALAGGAHFTGAVIQASDNRRPSSATTDVGWLARPARCIARNSQSPLRSPVNTRPVRLAPCAAGASPTTTMRAAGSPKPGTGRPQYALVPERRPLLLPATCSRHATSRGHGRQATTSRVQLRRGSPRGRPHRVQRVAAAARVAQLAPYVGRTPPLASR